MNISIDTLKELLVLSEAISKFNLVKRSVVNKDGEHESDPEHCYQLAVIAWYIIERHKLKFDQSKIFKYCLAHDLVELYAGDVDAFKQTKGIKIAKHQAEKESADKIKCELNFFKELHTVIERYEAKTDNESRFVYALDKVIPVINAEINNNEYLLAGKLTKQAVVDNKQPKTNMDELVNSYFNALVLYLDEKGDFFYPGCTSRDFSNKEYEF
jgi:putative hydrolase of HD superfamily